MKKFQKNNQSFTCEFCGKLVPLHPKSSRDHCCYCLYSKHVDINPGDRLNECKGLLKPIGIRSVNSKTQIVYQCSKCLTKVFNIVAEDDNKELLNELFTKVWTD